MFCVLTDISLFTATENANIPYVLKVVVKDKRIKYSYLIIISLNKA